MKKIILISLVILALFGCGEKKVTEKMLIGDWECSVIVQEAKWENGVFQDYAPPNDYGKLLVKYLKEEDELFVKWPTFDRKMKQDFKKLNGSYEDSIGDVKIAGFNRLEYISDNEFKSISEDTITNAKSENNEKAKVMHHCTRIK